MNKIILIALILISSNVIALDANTDYTEIDVNCFELNLIDFNCNDFNYLNELDCNFDLSDWNCFENQETDLNSGIDLNEMQNDLNLNQETDLNIGTDLNTEIDFNSSQEIDLNLTEETDLNNETELDLNQTQEIDLNINDENSFQTIDENTSIEDENNFVSDENSFKETNDENTFEEITDEEEINCNEINLDEFYCEDLNYLNDLNCVLELEHWNCKTKNLIDELIEEVIEQVQQIIEPFIVKQKEVVIENKKANCFGIKCNEL